MSPQAKNTFHRQCAVATLCMLTLNRFNDEGGATGSGARHAEFPELGEDALAASPPKRNP